MANSESGKLKEDVQSPMANSESGKLKEDGDAPTKRRFRRAKSAPLTHSNLPPANISGSDSQKSSPIASNKATIVMFLILALYLVAGTVIFILVRRQITGKKTNTVVDAIYFCIVTMTTVGYGDIFPGSNLVKMLACVFVFSGMAIMGVILSRAADYIVEKHEALMEKALHLREEGTPAEMFKHVEVHKTKYKFLMTLVFLILLITVGTLFLTFHEDMKPVEAFYCVCATITTLGYGIESFKSEGGRIFAIFWILSSTVCVAKFFFHITELYTERRHRSSLKWVLEKKLTFFDIEAADLDNDKVLSAAEYVLHKLKEMGKVNAEDIELLMESFRNLDVHGLGKLTAADVLNTASSESSSS